MTDERRFGDERVKEILRRAVELQHTGVVPARQGEGLSQSEVERVASEAGIDPVYVRRAIAESSSGSPETERSRFLGEVKTIEVVTILPDEVGPEEMDRMLEEVQRTFADTGNESRTERSATWTGSRQMSSSRLSNVMVAITARREGTEIRITERLDNLSVALFGGLGFGGSGVGVAISSAIGMGEFGMPLLFLAGATTAVGSCYGLARTLYARSARKRRRELQRLVARMVEVGISDEKLGVGSEPAGLEPGSQP
jgi:hypothetical protein